MSTFRCVDSHRHQCEPRDNAIAVISVPDPESCRGKDQCASASPRHKAPTLQPECYRNVDDESHPANGLQSTVAESGRVYLHARGADADPQSPRECKSFYLHDCTCG